MCWKNIQEEHVARFPLELKYTKEKKKIEITHIQLQKNTYIVI